MLWRPREVKLCGSRGAQAGVDGAEDAGQEELGED